MIPIFVRTRYEGLSAELAKGTSVRVWRQIMKESHAAIARLWHATMLPKHFKRMARNRYDYQPRSERYKARKARLQRRGAIEGFGDQDLVYRGLTRDCATRMAVIRGYPSRGKVEMELPSYVQTNYRPGRPNLAAEVLAVSPDEAALLNAELDRIVGARLKALNSTVTIKT